MNNTFLQEQAQNLAAKAHRSRRILAAEIRDSRRYFKEKPNAAARGFARLAQKAGHKQATPNTNPNTLIRLALQDRLNKAKTLSRKGIARKATEYENQLIMTIGAAAVSACPKTREQRMREAEFQEIEARVFRIASTLPIP